MERSDTVPAFDVPPSSPIDARATVPPVHGASRIVAFFGLLAVIAWLLDFAISQGLRGIATGDFGEWNRIVRGDVNAEIVITGSSRAQTHYDPRLIAAATGLSAYNIGLNGSQTDMQLARLKTYLRHNRKPQWVIQNLDAFSLQVSHGEVYDPGQYVPYLDEPYLYAALAAIDEDTWKARWLPLYGYAALDFRFGWLRGVGQRLGMTGASVADDFQGFRPRHTGWTGEFDAFRARHPNGSAIDIEPAGVAQLDALLRLCKSQGIGVVLVYSPEYLEMQTLTTNRAEIFARFLGLATRYGAELIDFSASPISRRKDLFYNSQHLNAAGAEAFTRELVGRLPMRRAGIVGAR